MPFSAIPRGRANGTHSIPRHTRATRWRWLALPHYSPSRRSSSSRKEFSPRFTRLMINRRNVSSRELVSDLFEQNVVKWKYLKPRALRDSFSYADQTCNLYTVWLCIVRCSPKSVFNFASRLSCKTFGHPTTSWEILSVFHWVIVARRSHLSSLLWRIVNTRDMFRAGNKSISITFCCCDSKLRNESDGIDNFTRSRRW